MGEIIRNPKSWEALWLAFRPGDEMRSKHFEECLKALENSIVPPPERYRIDFFRSTTTSLLVQWDTDPSEGLQIDYRSPTAVCAYFYSKSVHEPNWWSPEDDAQSGLLFAPSKPRVVGTEFLDHLRRMGVIPTVPLNL